MGSAFSGFLYLIPFVFYFGLVVPLHVYIDYGFCRADVVVISFVQVF